jgi:LL-diaminopimelate aminotransferase
MRAASRRLESLPKYLFAELEAVRERTRRERGEILDLSIGDPDLPTPEPVIEELARAARDPANHRYPTNRGLMSLREGAARWFKGRFGVELDPEREVLCLIGSKEGLGHLPLALCDPGDKVLVPDPGYPVYQSAATLAGATSVPVPLARDGGYLMDVESAARTTRGARLCYLNYPNNPTGAAATVEYYRGVVRVAAKEGLILCSDAAYSEITYDGERSPSILQVEGAKDLAVEFHSFSKTYNMTGWRVAFAVGNAEVLKCLESVKSNVDSGVFQAVQRAAVKALELGADDLERRRSRYGARRDIVVSALREMGCDVYPPRGAIYVWAKVPEGLGSMEFATELLKRSAVSVAPGSGFGAAGEGYFRISLTVPDDELQLALDRMRGLRLWQGGAERN